LEISFSQDGLLGIAVLLVIVIMIYLIIREIRLMRTNTRKLELELERDKLQILKQDTAASVQPALRLTTDQISALKEIEESNIALETEIFMKQKTIEGRLKRLENYVKREKLDLMLDRIDSEEKKI
jgi:flagellar biosynthesis/type III secretory pathway M-ring protein FliF/YscJ